jgi:hypothetical protein
VVPFDFAADLRNSARPFNSSFNFRAYSSSSTAFELRFFCLLVAEAELLAFEAPFALWALFEVAFDELAMGCDDGATSKSSTGSRFLLVALPFDFWLLGAAASVMTRLVHSEDRSGVSQGHKEVSRTIRCERLSHRLIYPGYNSVDVTFVFANPFFGKASNILQQLETDTFGRNGCEVRARGCEDFPDGVVELVNRDWHYEKIER